jgi:hypothetical protein
VPLRLSIQRGEDSETLFFVLGADAYWLAPAPIGAG